MPIADEALLLRDRLIAEAEGHFRQSQPEAAIALLRRLDRATIDETTLRLTDAFCPWIARGRQIVASCDPRRKPREGELVIIYGNYPHIFENLIVNNPAKRHAASFWDLKHDRIEYDTRWERISQIYIINMDSRPDKLDAVLRELASARAPFHRITRISASVSVESTGSRHLDGSIACLQSHLAVLRDAKAKRFEHTLVLEDDFCFTSDLPAHLEDLHTFFARRYSYWICLLATSKYGLIQEKDDLVSLTFQPCTKTAAYLVSREGIENLLPVQETALRRLRKTGDTRRYAADRYWAILQPSNKFLVFRRIFGFEVAGLSDIEGTVVRYLD